MPDEAGMNYYVGRYKSGSDLGHIVLELAASEEFQVWTRNKLFVPPGHFYSPIVDQTEARRHFDLLKNAPMPGSVAGVQIDRAELLALWGKLVPLMHDNPFSSSKVERLRYYFDNVNYSYGDGLVWHAMLRYLKPKRVIEIGSGYSSACLLDTVERYFDHEVQLTFVEPYPELLKRLISDAAGRVNILAKPVQNCDLDVFRALEAGDVLFIDSTHILRTGSDVCFELFEVLPVLRPGVVVHIHDMFWPFEYPEGWAVTDNRSWNELYAVRALLTRNPDWKVIMFNDYLAKTARDVAEQSFSLFLKNPGGGLYIQKQSDNV